MPSDRFAAFEALIEVSRRTHLADNLDHLFFPWGHELPDPTREIERLEQQRAVLRDADVFWHGLGDQASRDLFLRFLAYRALGPAHVRLQLDPIAYRRAVVGLATLDLKQPYVLHGGQPAPFEWQMHLFDLSRHDLPASIVGQVVGLASTAVMSQYAYRDTTVGACPRAGDVALDVGGCWGDTALWLAHQVGPYGEVHSFEPSPGNHILFNQNLELNTELAARVRLWTDAVGSSPDTDVWIEASIAAGAHTQETQGSPESASNLVRVRQHSIDTYLQRGAFPRIDFLKVDVEGADLGVLQGASEAIREFRPRLALAAYHKPDDLVTIPDFIAGLGVEYAWYLQCSTMLDVDTVAFGVPVSQPGEGD